MTFKAVISGAGMEVDLECVINSETLLLTTVGLLKCFPKIIIAVLVGRR